MNSTNQVQDTATAKAAHTPVPWRVLTEQECDHAVRIVAKGQPTNEYHVEVTYTGGNSEADAEFIVRACNSHEELLEALEAMLGDWTLTDRIKAREAIRKARGAA